MYAAVQREPGRSRRRFLLLFGHLVAVHGISGRSTEGGVPWQIPLRTSPPVGPTNSQNETDVRATGILALAIVFIGLAVLLLLAIIELWPSAGKTAGTYSTSHRFLGFSASLSLDDNLLVLAVLAGALGAVLHSVRSIAWYVGQRNLERTWTLYYLTLPVVGAMLVLLVYLLIRGGLISSGSAASVNPYGIAAIAALVGLFSQQAAQMLMQVFTTIFAKAPKGKDTSPPE